MFALAIMNSETVDDSPEIPCINLILWLRKNFPCLLNLVADSQWSEICETILGENVMKAQPLSNAFMDANWSAWDDVLL